MNLSDTLAALPIKPCPTPWCCSEEAELTGYPGHDMFVVCPDCGCQGPTSNSAVLAIAAWNTRTGQLVPVPSVERVADAIEACMGPLFGSPEYLADPVKRARAEKRRRDGAVTYATAVIAAMQEGRDGMGEKQ